MATTISAFNDMLQQFLDELVLTFPNEKSFKSFQTNFQILRKTNPRKPMTSFMESVTPHISHVMARDEVFFKEHADTIPFMKRLNIASVWNDDLPESTKSTIWQYIQTLYVLATTIMTLPAETLSMIESVAQKCAKDITDGNSELNEDMLKSIMSSFLEPQAKK
jgi:hypothetical protein